MNKKQIFVICEYKFGTNIFKNVTFELLSRAFELKLQGFKEFNKEYEVCAVVLDCGIDADFSPLFKHGAQRVIYLKNEKFRTYNLKYLGCALIELVKQKSPEIMLFGATNRGREIAPYVTSRLKTGLTADCTKLELVENKGEIKLASTRPTFGGVLMATILCKKNPQCATVREGVTPAIDKGFTLGEVEEIPLGVNYCDNSLVKLIEFIEKPCLDSSLENAQIIFAGGAGLKTKENVEKLKTLAQKFNAGFAVSRKLVEMGFATQCEQVGQTGKTVAPKLYITFGISGANQHIMGMNASKTVVAINKDENAPIFENCDYKIVADAVEIIDELLKI